MCSSTRKLRAQFVQATRAMATKCNRPPVACVRSVHTVTYIYACENRRSVYMTFQGANAQSAGLMSTSPPHSRRTPRLAGKEASMRAAQLKGMRQSRILQPVTLGHIIGAIPGDKAPVPSLWGPRCPPTRPPHLMGKRTWTPKCKISSCRNETKSSGSNFTLFTGLLLYFHYSTFSSISHSFVVFLLSSTSLHGLIFFLSSAFLARGYRPGRPSRLGPLSKRQPERGRKGKRAQASHAGTRCSMSGRETRCRQTCICRLNLTLALSRLPKQPKNSYLTSR